MNVDDAEEDDTEKFDADKELTEFIQRSKNILDDFYQRSFIQDKLGGLDSKEIIHRIKDTPSNTKNFVKKILKFCDKHGVRLDHKTGKVDLNLVGNPNIYNRLKANISMVKYALLQREDQYNHPHLKNQKIIADELRKEIFRMRKSERTEKEEALKAMQPEQKKVGSLIMN